MQTTLMAGRLATLALCALAVPVPGRAFQDPPAPQVDVASLFAPITLLPPVADSLGPRQAFSPGRALAMGIADVRHPETLEALLQGFAAAALPDPWSAFTERPSRDWRPRGFELGPGDHGLLWHLGGALSTLVKRPGGGGG